MAAVNVSRRTLAVEAGQRFGRGVVVDPEIRMAGGGKVRGARLRCDCGTEYEAALKSLLEGMTGSCGCLQRDRAAAVGRANRKLAVQAGQRFGRAVVVDPDVRAGKRGERGARLRCDCGTEYEAVLSRLLGGGARSCGCLRAEVRRESGRKAGSAPANLARLARYGSAPANLARLAAMSRSAEHRQRAAERGGSAEVREAFAREARSPDGRRRRTEIMRRHWSVPRMGSFSESVDGPGYVDCQYCDPPRRVPEERWEGHWARNHEPRRGREVTS
jgi:hypothetical protein